MLQNILHFFALYLNLFFLLTPFFVLGVFISMTEEIAQPLRRKLAFRITIGAFAVTLSIFLLGTFLMRLFGVTVDAFRAGSGVLLLLTAVGLVLSRESEKRETDPTRLLDMAIVPLATPITAGPATLGALMVMGTSPEYGKVITSCALLLACCSIGLMLLFSETINRALGKANIKILSKLTGLILSAMAMQMIILGAKNLWMAE